MNIFVLDEDVVKAASYHCKQHLTKMPLESAQMLSTVCRNHGDDSGYKSTHKHHPCTVWCGESLDNWEWVRELAIQMDLYKRKFVDCHRHKSVDLILKLKKPKGLKSRGLTDFAMAMPERFRSSDVVASYRRYYHSKLFAEWFQTPEWITPEVMYGYYVDQVLRTSGEHPIGEKVKYVPKNTVIKSFLKQPC